MAADFLLRGRADRIWALPADQEPWARVHGGGALAHSEEAWRAGEDQPARCGQLVKQLRAGDLTAVWVPDPRHEAMRDLTRAREVAVEDLRRKRQQVSAFLLRQGLHYPGER